MRVLASATVRSLNATLVLALAVLAVCVPAVAHAAAPTLAAAGDVACPPGGDPAVPGNCQQAVTAGLIRGLKPTAVAALGDLQYDSGTLPDFQASFDASWGTFKPLIHPAPGNHEYYTRDASGYYDYFNGVGGASGAAGNRGHGYYSYGLGDWHIVVLNSNCDFVPCGPGSQQEQWLRADLATYRAPCTLAYWHHPLFTSGPNRNDPNGLATVALWQALYDARADVILNGHAHYYERIRPQNPLGDRDTANGIREFVVGTGGRSLYTVAQTGRGSELYRSDFGVMALTLRSSGYDWRFLSATTGTFVDSGTGACHNAPPEVSSFVLGATRFAVGKYPTAQQAVSAAQRGTSIAYRLSKPASVRVAIAKLLPGRRAGRRCVAPRRRLARQRSCTRLIGQGALERAGQAGLNRIYFSGRIGRRPLSPGRYTAQLTATDNARTSAPQSRSFVVVAG
ncbi:MAG: hypothetical protein QOK04_553 [Solirubrobacteraceae bacterium]|jgi:hypothetical protein|nr:hypothetical protein [Solirubrobacteraceae bacterium]